MVCNDKTLGNENCHVEDLVKKIKCKSLKKVKKNQKKRVKLSEKTSPIEPGKKTGNTKQNDFKKATRSAESPVTCTKRSARKRKIIECYMPTSASGFFRNPFSEAYNDETIAEEKGHGEVPVKKMKWRSIKNLMKNQKKRMKWIEKSGQIEGKKKTQNSIQSDLKISKKARSSAKSPVASMKRPTRKRKTIERYSSLQTTAYRASRKPFPNVKGKGTRLKDIPKVAYKLSQSKHDDNLQILHTILFGRRTKEKQRSQIMHRINKCVKEKLFDLCDILDIPISNKSNTKKGDIAAKILEFLEYPRPTADPLIADEALKGKKQRGRAQSSKFPTSVGATSQRLSKKQIKSGEKQSKSRKKHKRSKNIQNGEEPSACKKSYDEDDENDGMSEESDPDAWYNYKYGRHEDVEVGDDLWDPDIIMTEGCL